MEREARDGEVSGGQEGGVRVNRGREEMKIGGRASETPCNIYLIHVKLPDPRSLVWIPAYFTAFPPQLNPV